MRARHIALALLATVWAGSSTAYAAQQGRWQQQADYRDRDMQMRFREMDADGDGVITRAEWRGNAQSFRQQDTNHDGVLSGDEVWVSRGANTNRNAEFTRADRNNNGALERSEWRGNQQSFDQMDRNNDGVVSRREYQYLDDESDVSVTDLRPFASLDRNNNGVITSGEWIGRVEDFRALDVDGDGVVTQSEYQQGRTLPQSPAYRAGRDRGLADGRQAGREDKTINGGKWDLDGQRELETADAGYSSGLGSRSDYQTGYRDGFRLGYREGFGPR
jgi:Ca2+-binding EF-hand superfamily protein